MILKHHINIFHSINNTPNELFLGDETQFIKCLLNQNMIIYMSQIRKDANHKIYIELTLLDA